MNILVKISGITVSSWQITKFGSACEIPARFIEKNVSLRGRVHRVTKSGLEVEHVPINVPLLSPLLKNSKSTPILLPP